MKVFIDVGSHDGETLNEVLDKKYNFDKIYCIEPSKESISKLKKFKDNRIKIFPVAFGNENKKSKLFSSGDLSASIYSNNSNSKFEEINIIKTSEWFDLEIKEGDINKNYPKKVIFESKDEEKNVKLSATHNGYLKNYNKICKRKLYIDKKTNFFSGEDSIISAKSNIEKNVFHIRFHLMPDISTTVTENKKNIILRTKKKIIYGFLNLIMKL